MRADAGAGESAKNAKERAGVGAGGEQSVKKRMADERARGYAEGRGSGEKQELPGAGNEQDFNIRLK